MCLVHEEHWYRRITISNIYILFHLLKNSERMVLYIHEHQSTHHPGLVVQELFAPKGFDGVIIDRFWYSFSFIHFLIEEVNLWFCFSSDKSKVTCWSTLLWFFLTGLSSRISSIASSSDSWKSWGIRFPFCDSKKFDY